MGIAEATYIGVRFIFPSPDTPRVQGPTRAALYQGSNEVEVEEQRAFDRLCGKYPTWINSVKLWHIIHCQDLQILQKHMIIEFIAATPEGLEETYAKEEPRRAFC